MLLDVPDTEDLPVLDGFPNIDFLLSDSASENLNCNSVLIEHFVDEVELSVRAACNSGLELKLSQDSIRRSVQFVCDHFTSGGLGAGLVCNARVSGGGQRIEIQISDPNIEYQERENYGLLLH